MCVGFFGCVLMCVVHGTHFCIHSTATKNVGHKLFRSRFIFLIYAEVFLSPSCSILESWTVPDWACVSGLFFSATAHLPCCDCVRINTRLPEEVLSRRLSMMANAGDCPMKAQFATNSALYGFLLALN